jgi:hypothetical protein
VPVIERELPVLGRQIAAIRLWATNLTDRVRDDASLRRSFLYAAYGRKQAQRCGECNLHNYSAKYHLDLLEVSYLLREP